MSELFLVRHGQASFGAADYDQLSSIGYKQSKLLGHFLSAQNLEFDRFACGDMRRHFQTLTEVCVGMKLNNKNPEILPGLNEYDFEGMYEAYGKVFGDNELFNIVQKDISNKKNYYRLLRQILSAWVDDLIPDAPESWNDFQFRVKDSLNKIMSNSETGSKVLVIASGGSISALVGLVLGIPNSKVFDLNLQYLNTGVSHFFFNKQKINLSGFNSISHLQSKANRDLITYG